ncbi:hypothetical protein TNCV_3017041 [Trichonephila clavipes]|nr:hypothetical protein TNCV_3017041 [Trichonephila clavipes]
MRSITYYWWLDHLYRYAVAFPTKKVTFSKIEGNRRRGGPPARWLDNVKKDLKVTGIKLWKAIATDRVNWKRISESALACRRVMSL